MFDKIKNDPDDENEHFKQPPIATVLNIWSLAIKFFVFLLKLLESIPVVDLLDVTFLRSFLQTADQPTTYQWPPTNLPTDHLPPTTDQVHRPRTNRPPFNKKYED